MMYDVSLMREQFFCISLDKNLDLLDDEFKLCCVSESELIMVRILGFYNLYNIVISKNIKKYSYNKYYHNI